MFQEFKNFALKGNVLDLAVGVIIGGAFGKIVASFVGDVVMPMLGVLTGKVNLAALKWVISPAEGEVAELAVMYGQFLQTCLDFFLVALSIFLVIKAINNFKKKEEEKPAEEVKPSTEELLLTEIRDLLKAGR